MMFLTSPFLITVHVGLLILGGIILIMLTWLFKRALLRYMVNQIMQLENDVTEQSKYIDDLEKLIQEELSTLNIAPKQISKN